MELTAAQLARAMTPLCRLAKPGETPNAWPTQYDRMAKEAANHVQKDRLRAKSKQKKYRAKKRALKQAS